LNKNGSTLGLLKLEERRSNISHKGSIGDVSCTDLQFCNDLKNIMKKPTHGKKQPKISPFADLLPQNLENILNNDLLVKLETIKEELETTRKEKESILSELNQQKEEVKKKDKEIDLLKNNGDSNSLKAQIDNFTYNVDKLNTDLNNTSKTFQNRQESLAPPCDHMDELKKLKQEVSEKEGNLDILNLKIDELSKSNRDLQNLNESLKDQLQKRKEKMDNEMSTLYQQIQSLEIKKNEYERMNRSLVDQNNLNLSQHREDEAINAQLNSQNSFHSTKKDSNMILELKTENKLLTKKLDEIKSKYEKEINGLKNDISTKDSRIKEVEVTFNKIDKELKEKK